jgi:hypothetical protein
MEVSVIYDGKRYKFCNIGSSRKWVDNRNIIVPVIMNQILRKQAVKDGVDPEVFTAKKPEKPEGARVKKAKVSSRQRKGSVNGGINLSSLIKVEGDVNVEK